MREKLYNVWYQPCESHVWHLQIHAVSRVAAENIIESLLRQRYHTMLEEYTPIRTMENNNVDHFA